ncbi:DNAj-like protein [Cryptosporidium canis]|uniref:DNAj-like protein n=1 Tax=Cryptosporidium canis TaxID=195482 RepID=A0ABQ8P9B3_9CRYT|nr:DNAj-like protein [Cryptosporidium canis]
MRETVSEETCGSESGGAGRGQGQAGDDLFDLFMREVGEGGGDRESGSRRSKRARVSRLLMEGRIEEAISSSYGGEDLATGTSEEEILRLTSRVFANAYDVLGLPVDSEAAVISRKYRKLSLLIHPDKTRHEKAREAFETVRRAYEELQQAESRTKYREVWKRAEELVRKENKKRSKALSNKSEEFNKQVIEMSEKLLNDLKERREYSERCLLANHRFEQELYRQKLDQEKEMCIQRQKWSEKFEERAEGWRSYKQSNSKLFSGKSSLEKDD